MAWHEGLSLFSDDILSNAGTIGGHGLRRFKFPCSIVTASEELGFK
jgi:hypothetical protein